MSEITHCSECGDALPEYWPKGLCPGCALGGALDEPVGVVQSSGGARFGDFELLEEVGRGGMGVIYRARQVSLNRIVALKMILGGQFASKQEVLRFRSEAEAAATLQHPNIVRIYETGEQDGHHYFSMDYVEGRTLADIVRDGPLPAQRAARYALSIAETIHYAHSQGVLHRDLKPSNVIIDGNDQPRVTDFGLAKRVRGDFGVTVTGQVLGSPNFMPPEQTSAKGGKVGAWSDVYGIGAILYHLLTGRPPFQAETIEEILLLLRDADPVSPRLMNPSVPRDLETLCLKCLEKEPVRRYANAQALADELKRFLADEPIEARPLRAVSRVWRWCRRRPAMAMLSASVLLLLLVVAFGSSLAAWRVDRARRAERSANQDLRKTVSLLELERGEDFFNGHDAASGVAHLSAMLRRDPSNSIVANRLVSALTQRGWALPKGLPMQHARRIAMASFSPDGLHVLTASWDKTASVWDAVNGRRLFSLKHEDVVFAARYSADGRGIITASADGIAQICNASRGATQSLLRHSNKVHWAEFSKDGTLAVTACADEVARIWDAATGRLKRELRGHTRPVVIARFDPDGKLVATATDWGGLRVWSVESGKLLFKLAGHQTETAIESLAFSSDGQHLVSGGYDRTARLWDVATGQPIGEPLKHRLRVWHVEFSPDSKLLLTVCEDGAGRLWDVQTLRSVGEPLRHESGVIFGQFSPDGQSIVTTSSDNTARVWDVRTQRPLCQPLRYIGRVLQAGFSPDSGRLVTASYYGVAQIWELRKPVEPGVQIQHDRNAVPIALNPDSTAILTAGQNKTMRLWDVRSGRPLSEPMVQKEFVTFGDIAPDGRHVALAFADHAVFTWDYGEWQPPHRRVTNPRMLAGPLKHTGRIHSVRFSPDSSRIVTASADGTARVWDATSGVPITPSLVHTGPVLTAQFSRDGTRVVSASEDRTARIWDAQSGQAVTEPLAHRDHVKWAEFSPDGARVVTASTDSTACLWDTRTGRKLMTLQHERIVNQCVFSADGHRVATGSLDRTARIWDSHTGQALTPPLRHASAVDRVYLSVDGQRLATAAHGALVNGGLMRVWDANTGRPLSEWLTTKSPFGVSFDPINGRVIMGSKEGTLQIWDIPEAPIPVPEWFPEFAEALAGIRLGARGSVELVAHEELSRFAGQIASGERNFYERLAQRLLTPTAE